MYLKFPLLTILAIYISGCGYALVGTQSSLPSYMKKIAIPVFENTTSRYQLEVIVTNQVIQKFQKYKNVAISTSEEDADAILLGKITNYRQYSISYNPDGTSSEYRIEIAAEIVLKDLVKKEIYYENKNFSSYADFKASADLDTLVAMEQEAWEEAAKKFAESLAGVIIEGF